MLRVVESYGYKIYKNCRKKCSTFGVHFFNIFHKVFTHRMYNSQPQWEKFQNCVIKPRALSWTELLEVLNRHCQRWIYENFLKKFYVNSHLTRKQKYTGKKHGKNSDKWEKKYIFINIFLRIFCNFLAFFLYLF